MRTHWMLALALLVFVAACGEKTEQAADTAKTTGDSHSVADAPASHQDGGEAEVVLTGTLGCGHCTYKKGDDCSTAIQTADGQVYILENLTEDTEAFQKRFGGKELKIMGNVVKAGDPTHVQVKTHEFL